MSRYAACTCTVVQLVIRFEDSVFGLTLNHACFFPLLCLVKPAAKIPIVVKAGSSGGRAKRERESLKSGTRQGKRLLLMWTRKEPISCPNRAAASFGIFLNGIRDRGAAERRHRRFLFSGNDGSEQRQRPCHSIHIRVTPPPPPFAPKVANKKPFARLKLKTSNFSTFSPRIFLQGVLVKKY